MFGFGKIECKYCGKKLKKDAKFCEFCGGTLTNETKTNPTTEKDSNYDFSATKLAIIAEDIFQISGRGVVVLGMAQSSFKVGTEVVNTRTNKKFKIKSIEMFRKVTNEANPRDNCGLLFETAEKSDFQRGDKLMF